MIGQTKLINEIKRLIDTSHFPKFSIIWGPKGSGKKCLCNCISNMLQYNTVICPDMKVDTIRDIINEAYTNKATTLYIIPDSDNMSLAAKNTLLKVTEEPPNNAYFIMTLQDLNNTLPTITSRGVTFQMNNYTVPELLDYYKLINPNMQNKDIIKDICEVPGDIQYLNDIGTLSFYEFVNKVFDNIAVVNGSNAFKIGSNLALKENSTGYDLKMFLTTFKLLCWNKYIETKDDKLLTGVNITDVALKKCSYKSINKQMVFDTWILSIREAWM